MFTGTIGSCNLWRNVSTLNMEVACFSEIQIDFQRTTQIGIPVNRTLQRILIDRLTHSRDACEGLGRITGEVHWIKRWHWICSSKIAK
jgi:hypothetical protein